MASVAVGGLHNYIIRTVQILRILDQRLSCISDITGEDDLLFFIPFTDRQLYTCRSQKMACINKADRNSLCRSDHLFIWTAHEIPDNTHGIFHGISRYKFRFALTFALSVTPLSLEHLNMRTVTKHNITQVAGSICRIDRPLETFRIDCGQIA